MSLCCVYCVLGLEWKRQLISFSFVDLFLALFAKESTKTTGCMSGHHPRYVAIETWNTGYTLTIGLVVNVGANPTALIGYQPSHDQCVQSFLVSVVIIL